MASSSFTSQPFLSSPLSRTQPLSRYSNAPPPPQPPRTLPSETPKLSSASLANPVTPIEVDTSSNVKKPSKSSGTLKVDSTDWIASPLTRRFGLGAGLVWAGFLAVGVISEQIKTGLEVSQELANTRDLEKEEEVILPNGVRYYEMRVGGGATPRKGDLVVADLKGTIKDNGEMFVDTFGRNNKSLALVMGSSRPYSRGMCEGIESVLKTMKGGSKRRVVVPAKLGYGETGADFGSGVVVPPSATLEYIVELDRVSIAPA